VHDEGTPVAFWLVPAEPWRSALEQVIADLAARQAAPPFPPHVTLFTGRCALASLPAVCQHVLAAAPEREPAAPLRMGVKGVGHSSDFFKTLYLELETDAISNSVRDSMCAAFGALDLAVTDRPYEPHVSLIYKRCSESARRSMALEITAPNAIVCDTVMAVVPSGAGWEEVSAWRVVSERVLSG
jgi:2'-5' RNA ligase